MPSHESDIPFLKQWQWVMAVLATMLLPATWYWSSYERLNAVRLERLKQHASVMVPLEGKVAADLAAWSGAQANVASVKEKIRAIGEMPELWARRTITIENQRMSRAEVEKYLSELTNSDSSLLVPTTINVRAAKPSESVFVAHQGLDGPEALIVTIKADLYSRSQP